MDREIDQFFGRVFSMEPMWDVSTHSLKPLYDIRETKNHILVTVDLPYVKKEDIELTLKLMRIIKTDIFDGNVYTPLPCAPIYDAMSEEDKKNIEEKMEALKKVKDGNDAEAIKKASDELSHAAQKIGEEMYKSQQGQPEAGHTHGEAKEEKKSDEGEVKEGKIEE